MMNESITTSEAERLEKVWADNPFRQFAEETLRGGQATVATSILDVKRKILAEHNTVHQPMK